MHDTPEPHPTPESAVQPKPGWSWWWIFPALLAGYIAYSAISYFPLSKPKPTADGLLNQSLAAAQAGRYQECITTAQDAVKLHPSAEAYNNIGFCSAQMGNWNEGIRNTLEALKLQPAMERARNNLLWMVGQRDGKAPTPNTPPAAPAVSPADGVLLLSLQHAQARRFPECIAAARQAVQLNPRSAEAYNNLGYCSGGLGKWDEGIQYLDEALRLKPDFALAKGNLSWLRGEKAKADSAIRPH
jgi:Flp pilus assembly protein TadD